jgi:RHS repeat-associated protein
LTTTWTWDTAPSGIGRLHEVTSPDAIKTYGYDKRGQTKSVTLGVNGDAFAAHFTYDEFGRVKGVDYPQPLGMAPFGVAYDYDAHGYRIAVRDKATNDPYWELKEVDNAGRIQKEHFGNETETKRSFYNDKQALKSITTTHAGSTIQELSYDWDERLNLKRRTDALQAQHTTERFRYDALNRLTCAYFGFVDSANADCDTSYGYAPNGNLTTKSDVGSLSYTDPKHPHAVTDAAGASHGYNAVGNQITRPGGTTVTYTPFDLPKTITQLGKTVSFGYDGDQQRIRKTSSTTETIYFEDLYERVENTANGLQEHRYYVFSPERAIAIVTRGGAEPGTKFLHVDHLGSTETVTDEQGKPVERRSYDAFGTRRNPEWGEPPIAFASKTQKGFTGHEDEDDIGLVNMRGRLMDLKLGRFTTTDPVIADIFDGQSFGAYAYVHNNPLSLVDPTGFVANEPTTTLPGTYCCIEETATIVYPDGFEPEPPKVEDDFIITNHPANIGAYVAPVDVGTTGPGGDGLPQEATVLEPQGRSIGQLVGGYLFGVGEGLVPFAAVGHSVGDSFGLSDNKSAEARIGLAIGQIVGGTFALIGGFSGEVLGGIATVSGVGAALGVPVMAVSTVAVVGGLGNIAAGIRGLASVMSGGGGGGGNNGQVRVGGQSWRAFEPGAKACQNGCEAVARSIQRSIGGEVKVITSPGRFLGRVRDSAGEFVNPAGPKAGGWSNHHVVVKDGRVYDALTGPNGMSTTAYKQMWEFGDVLNFGF